MIEPTARPVDAPGGEAVRAVERFLARAADVEPVLRAFRAIDAERLRADAAAADALPASDRGPLYGMLVAVKEVIDVAGYECGWGTPIHAGRRPAVDAWPVARLREAGALVAGITVSTEYAMSSPGPTTNPFDARRTPGASSQGSAAAVGAGLVTAALGSQTIGSIIRPAAYCGCIGFKPTWGAIALDGTMPLSAPLDHVGFLAADPATAGALMDALMPAADGAGLPQSAFVLRPWYAEGASRAVQDAVATAADRLAAGGADIIDVDLPGWIAEQEARSLDTLLACDMARHHGGDFDAHGDLMSERVQDFIRRGRAVSDIEYDAALIRRGEIADALDAWIGDHVVLMPATTDVAPYLTEGTGSRDPQRLWTLSGLPAMTVPASQRGGLPVGVQVIARRGADRRVLATVAALFSA